MKLLTFLLLLIAVNCSGQKKDTAQGYGRDVPANWITPFQVKIYDTAQRVVYYDVWLGGHGKTYPAGYKIRDSAWVIKDSVEALKILLWHMEQQAKLYRRP